MNARKICFTTHRKRAAKIATHTRTFTPLTVKKIRHFGSFGAASVYINHRLQQQPNFLFNIHQTSRGWTVSRVVTGVAS